MTKYLKVEGHGDLVRDTGSTAILNTNRPAYEMAKKIGGEAIQKYGDHDAKIIHRLGFVAVAEPSVVLRIATPHSKLAYQLSEWYLDKIKNTLPIWKKFV